MNWWQRLLRRGKMEEQLEKELRFHFEQHASELIAQGPVSPVFAASYENCRGMYQQFPFWNSARAVVNPIPCSLPPIPFPFTLMRTLLHFFARTKKSTPFFSSDSALSDQNNRGWGYLRKSHSFPASKSKAPPSAHLQYPGRPKLW